MSNSSKCHENKTFVVVYRAFAFLLGIWGILATAGVFKNAFNPVTLLAYTVQSNILVTVFFAILLVRTIRYKERQSAPVEKHYGFFPRLSMFVTLVIFATMLVDWFILVPINVQGVSLLKLLAPDNLVVHLFMPLLMLADYLMFTERGKLKRTDVLLCLILPYIYLLETMPLGFTHTVSYISLGMDTSYPYPFLDVDKYGAWVILMVAGITLFFTVIAFIWQRVDNRIAAKKKVDANSVLMESKNF